jgi:hypothetical protein
MELFACQLSYITITFCIVIMSANKKYYKVVYGVLTLLLSLTKFAKTSDFHRITFTRYILIAVGVKVALLYTGPSFREQTYDSSCT